MNTKYIWLLLILLGFIACNDTEDVLEDNNMAEEDLPALTSGTADFSNFVSIGNSLTAGYTDGALFIAAQENSLPNILAGKFASIGGGSFTQPLMADNVGGLLFGEVPSLDDDGVNQFAPRFYFNGSGPERLSSASSTEVFEPLSGPFNNVGVPGAKSYHLLYDGYGNPANLATDPATANPYFVRMASALNATVLGDAMSQSPSFFSLWIGNNDVLGYASSGGESDMMSDDYDPITPSAGLPGVGFDQTYGALITTLTSGGAQGIVANIPYVTTIPHFTTVPHNPLDPTNPAFGPQIPTLNMIFGALNLVYGDYGETNRIVIFSETEASAVVIKDESLTSMATEIMNALAPNPDFIALIGQFGLPPSQAPGVAFLLGQIYGQTRQATEDDLFVLPSSTVIGTVNTDNVVNLMTNYGLSQTLAGLFSVEGISLPLADKWVLLPSEQMEIKDATDAFNATIEASATQAGLAFVDANSLLQQLFAGELSSNGFEPTSSLVTGGAFSLDGVHPTARGYALIANEFMRAIDATYGSNFEESGNFVDIGDYPTNYSPLLQ